ncbi:hypothetical protein [Methylotenera sp. 1P/1]|uniref:hypothetical protein n=1 Tax=Methylotenera sp. 1P/1 TaxID=1131551 RepID=UPI0012FC9570|nr:hypothetical protein [Methylotenera sp. 1P/1]
MTKYIEPSQGEIARLKIVNNSNLFLRLTTFEDGSTCKGWQELIPPKDQLEINNRDLKQMASFSINIRANAEFSLQTHGYFAYVTKCEMLTTFYPQPNLTYEMHYSYNEGACSLGVIKLVKTPDGTKAEPEKTLRQREIVAGITNSGSICK